jgi:hypothetical protein
MRARDALVHASLSTAASTVSTTLTSTRGNGADNIRGFAVGTNAMSKPRTVGVSIFP